MPPHTQRDPQRRALQRMTGQRIKRVREEAGMLQKELAQRLGFPLGPKVARAVRAYRDAKPPSPAGIETIWLSARRTALSHGAFGMMLENLGTYTDPPVEHVIAHRFRHTYAVEHYRQHRDIRALQWLLGHAKISTTETYLRTLGASYALDANLATPDEWLT